MFLIVKASLEICMVKMRNENLKKMMDECFGANVPDTAEFKRFANAVDSALSTDVQVSRDMSLLEQSFHETAAVTVCDEKGIILSVNNRFTQLSGYQADEIKGKHISCLFHSNEHRELNKTVQKAFRNSDTWKGESRMRSVKGGTYWVSITMVVQRDEQGHICKYMSSMTDITALKVYQEEFINSEYRYKDVVNSVREVIFQIDHDSEFVLINEAWRDITGFNINDSIGMSLIDYLHEEDKQALQSELTRLNEARVSSVNCTIRIITRDAQYIWCDFFARLMLRDDGNVIGITGTLENISEKRRNEESLMNALAFNKALLDSAEQAIIATDPKGSIISFNKGAEKLLGYRAEQIIGKFRLEQFHDSFELESRRSILQQEAGYEITGSFQVLLTNSKIKTNSVDEWTYIHSGGKRIPVQLNITAIRDDNGIVRGYLSMATDITNRKQSEEALMRSEKKHRDLVSYSQGLICTHTKEGKILSVNPAVCEATGYTAEELTGRNLSDLIPDEFRERFFTEYLAGFRQAKVSHGILVLSTKNGDALYLLYKNYLVDEKGESPYVIGFAQDISNRLKMERDLKTAIQQAEDSARTKELFLGNISHEIRTPINGIVGLTNLLLKSGLNDKQQQFATSVKDSAENLNSIINDLLDLNEIRSGNLELNEHAFDLSNLLYNLNQTYRKESGKKNLDYIFLPGDDIPEYIYGDPHRLNQILSNLLSNAVKFTTRGEITFVVKKTSVENNLATLSFSVKDTGIGIDSQMQQSIFNSFTQADTSSRRNYGGTGMGLTITKSLLNMMNSDICIASENGQGSEFSFDITVPVCEQESLQSRQKQLHNTLSGVTILIAEDNKVNQLFAKELLEDWGAAIEIADNGAIATEWLRSNSCDLILMDIQMPVMDGLEATEIIRKGKTNARHDIPVIAITANAKRGEEGLFLKAGFQKILFKPYDPVELHETICAIINPENAESCKISQEFKATHGTEMQYASLEVLEKFSRGKTSFISRMLHIIVDSIPASFLEMENAAAGADWESVQRIAHKLVPNANMTGNNTLDETIKWLEENALLCEDKNEVLEKIRDAALLMRNVIAELKQAKLQLEELQ